MHAHNSLSQISLGSCSFELLILFLLIRFPTLSHPRPQVKEVNDQHILAHYFSFLLFFVVLFHWEILLGLKMGPHNRWAWTILQHNTPLSLW